MGRPAVGLAFPSVEGRRPKLLVIFGAGASFDSADLARQPMQNVARPPLAAHLVDEEYSPIAARIPRCLPVVDRLRLRMSTGVPWSLEHELGALADAATDSPERREHLMAFRFYLHRVIEDSVGRWSEAASGLTWYLTLLNHLFDWMRRTGATIRLATFNYDLLLDSALTALVGGWELSDVASYIQRRDFRLFKLHGSIDWSRIAYTSDSFGTNLEAALYFAREHNVGTGPIEVRRVNQVLGEARRSPPPAPWEITVPALAVPMSDKTAFECPVDHENALRGDLPDVTHVLVIGWRAAEAHAVDLLDGDGLADHGLMPGYRLGIVSGDEDGAHETQRNLGRVAEKGRQLLEVTDGFSGLITRLATEFDNFLIHDRA
jgi:hypothetical protein